MKKLSLAFLLFFLAAPSAYAYNFGASGIVAGLAGAGIALGLTFGAIPALATVAIGAAIMGITFDPTAASAEDPAVTVQISPAAKLETPAGWPDPVTPPSTAAPVKQWTTGGFVSFVSAEDSCHKWGGVVGEAWGVPICIRPDGIQAGMGEGIGCPSGYMLNGSCLLSDASKVMKPKDNKCVIKRVGNAFAVDPQDPDCATLPATVDVQPSYVSQTLPDGSTKTVMLDGGSGAATVTETKPDTATNTTQTNTTKISAPDASGTSSVTGQGSGATAGTGTANTGVGVPIFDKSGLATEGTLAGIKSDTGAIKDALSGEGLDSSLSAAKSAFDSAVDGIVGMFEGEGAKDAGGIEDGFDFGGYLPQQCGCTPLTMTIMGHTRSYNWCAPMETIKSALAWVLGIFAAWYCLMLFRVGGSK